MHVEILAYEDALKNSAIASAWHQMSTQLDASVFQTRAWAEAWNATFGHGELKLAVAFEGTSVQGVMPLARQSRQVHRRVPVKLNFWGVPGSGIGAADHCGPLALSREASAALIEGVRDFSGGRLLLEHWDQQFEPLLREAGLHSLGETRVPRLDLTDRSLDDLWRKKIRKNLARRRRLMAEDDISGRWITEAAEVREAIVELRSMHIARWKQQGEPGIFDERRLSFLIELNRRLDGPHHRAEVFRLGTPDRPVGAILVFVTPQTMSSFKTGWAPDRASLGLGVELHASAIERAVSLNLGTYDFLRGTGAHKYSLGATDARDVSFGAFRGLPGRLLRERETRSYSRVESADPPAAVP